MLIGLVPIIGALAETATRKWERIGYRFLLVGVFLRGLTTYSRGGFLSAAVVGIFGLIRSPRKFRTLIGAAVIVAIVAAVMPQRFWDRMNTINASEEQRDDSAAGRLHFWVIAGQMAQAKPLTGVGFNAYNLSYEAYNGPPESSEFSGARSVHSIWFGALAEMGYPGFMLFVAMFCLSFWSCWRVSTKVKNDPGKQDLRIYANALLTSLAAYAVGGSFLPFQYNEMFWHFVALSTALTFLAQEEPSVVSAAAVPATPLRPAMLGVARATLPK